MAERIVVRELITTLGFEEVGSGIDDWLKRFGSLEAAALGIVGAMATATAAMFGFAVSTGKAAEELKKTEDKLGISAQDFQELSYGAGIAGLSVEGLQTGLKFLAKNVDLVRSGNKEAIKTFNEMSPAAVRVLRSGKPLNQVFAQLGDIFKNMPDAGKRVRLAMALAGRSGTELIPIWREGSRGLEEMARQANIFGYVMSKEDIEAASKFDDSLDKIHSTFGGLGKLVGSVSVAVFQPLVDTILQWWEANEAIVKQDLITAVSALGTVIVFLAKAFFLVLGVVDKLLAPFGGISGFIKDFIVGFSILAGAIAIVYGWWVILSALILDDFYTWAEGGDSVFGSLIEGFMGVVNWFKEGALEIWQFVDYYVLRPFRELWDMLTNIPGKISSLASGAANFFGFGSPSSSPTSGTSSVSNSSVGGSVSVSAPINVTVPEGTPAGMIGDRVQKGIGDGLSSTLRQANHILKPAVVR